MPKPVTDAAVNEIRGVLHRIRDDAAGERNTRRQRGRETSAAITAAARELYMAEGYAGLTLGKVADACGANKGNIAYYFPAKSDLLRAVLLQQLAQYLENHIEQAEQRSGDPEAILRAIIALYIEDAATSYLFYHQTWGYVASDREARALVSDIYSVVIQFISTLLQAAKPEISRSDAKVATLEIMQVVEGLTIHFGLDLASERMMKTLQKKALHRINLIIRGAGA